MATCEHGAVVGYCEFCRKGKSSISYKTRLPGGIMRVVTFDERYNKAVTYVSPKRKKKKS